MEQDAVDLLVDVRPAPAPIASKVHLDKMAVHGNLADELSGLR